MKTANTLVIFTYIVLLVLSLYLYSKREKSSPYRINLSNITFSKIYTVLLPAAIILIGIILRFYKIAQIPYGMHQDEASIGYEAYILANYGMQVIDSGVAVLNMHAPWEIISKADLYEAYMEQKRLYEEMHPPKRRKR